ncbi:FkbM family methyltransferase [Roseimicrobium sp. ORNL1]|uniref:FkbM family methyltransferase n=1 Tax=Roseimicrobium sp. ORNL1 TaxID=2711231 RepID=UPI0013E16037|nr:FkbM family methyltransferase [Roseimicrobium sp. ORNL1]QIF02950.1 FkbM family methyltransferase [Roseimicrobium sp. ORNL1]
MSLAASIQGALGRYRESRLERHLGGVDVLHVQGVELNVTGLSISMKKLLISGGFEKAETEVARSLVQPGDRILDLGAGLGFVGLYAMKFLAAAQITAVEANPNTFELLKDNYGRNKVSADFVHAAAGSVDGTLRLSISGDFWEDRVADGERGATGDVREVPAVSFETLFKQYGNRMDVLMMDIEGAEVGAVHTTIPGGVRSVIIEIHPDLLSKEQVGDVTNWLVRQGYRLVNSWGRVLGFEREQ